MENSMIEEEKNLDETGPNIVGQITVDLIEYEDTYGLAVEKNQEHVDLFTVMMEELMDDAGRRSVDGLIMMCRQNDRNVLANEIEKFIGSFGDGVIH